LPAIRHQRIELRFRWLTSIVRIAEIPAIHYEDPLAGIDWNGIDRDCWWLPPETLSLAGIAEFEALPLDARRRLSHYEYAHLLEIGVWLEALFVERLARLVRRTDDFEARSRYLREIREEAGHSLMFVELIRRSGVTLPSRRSASLRLAETLGRGVASGSALFWAMVVIGEELPYRLTRRLERGVDDVMLSAVVYRMAQLHGRDEAAHASYARERCREETQRLRDWQRALLSPALSRMLDAFSTYLYFPPMAVYRCAGLPRSTRWRSLALSSPRRRHDAAAMLRPTLEFLRRIGWRVPNPYDAG
jgi:P-aminobenzoate N-oxygenase AurF